MLGVAFKSRVNRLTAYKSLHDFALGLVSIFIPVFIAQQGFSPFTVFSYILVDVTAFGLASLPVGKTISRYGKEIGLLISSLLYILVFVMLQSLNVDIYLIYTVGALTGIGGAFHWIPVNTEFTDGSEEESRGESYGKLEGVPRMISPFAPLIGAAIMAYIGFNYLATLALVVAGFSIIPLLKGDEDSRPDFDLRGLIDRENMDLFALYFLDGFATTAYVFILPLFIYYVVGGTINLGWAKTFMAIGAGFFSIATGRITDRIEHETMLVTGTLASGLVYLFVPGLSSRVVAFLLSFAAGLTYTFYTVPLVSIVADIGDQGNILGFFSVRELFQSVGKIAVISILLVLLRKFEMALSFEVIFYLSALSLVLIALAVRKVKMRRNI